MSKIEIIAELGVNHNGDMKLLKEMILRVRECGCVIIKTQLYDPAKLFPSKEIWTQNRNWYPEVEKTKLTKEQLFKFAEWCREVGAEPMASAYDLERLSWLIELNVKRYKIATRINQDKELIDTVLSIGKEVFLSCQRRHLAYIPSNKIKVLYCVPSYPTQLNKLEFNKIGFPYEFQGFSSHYPGIEPALMAIARGAQIVEVHFCLSRKIVNNPDITSSVEPKELRELVRIARVFEKIEK